MKLLSLMIHFLHSFLVFIFQIFPDNVWGNKLRGKLYSILTGKSGKNLQIAKSVNILSIRNLSVGDNVFIGHGVWVNALGGLNIGDNVMFGPYCTVSTANHTRGDSGDGFRWGKHQLRAVHIGSNCWFGAHVNILPGTVVGEDVLVGAGAIISGNIVSNSLYCNDLATLKKYL
ncbi:acyltransferase [Shewanella algae]|uniref:acyltransferase n=1 Tax=Shewanella algae TaxID=38313 RepID=UPI001183E76F|nr:acyltransferase [Shewanella algae]